MLKSERLKESINARITYLNVLLREKKKKKKISKYDKKTKNF